MKIADPVQLRANHVALAARTLHHSYRRSTNGDRLLILALLDSRRRSDESHSADPMGASLSQSSE